MAGAFINVKGVNLGQLEKTSAINDIEADDVKFENEIRTSIARYAFSDWGDCEQVDQEANDHALACGELGLMAKYSTSQGSIYIITESDRSITKVLFCNECKELKENLTMKKNIR